MPEESQPALDLSGLLSMLASVDSQVTSLEAAMDPRTSREREGGLSEAYGRQAYESLGPMLREIQTTSAAMANQVQVGGGGDDGGGGGCGCWLSAHRESPSTSLPKRFDVLCRGCRTVSVLLQYFPIFEGSGLG